MKTAIRIACAVLAMATMQGKVVGKAAYVGKYANASPQ